MTATGNSAASTISSLGSGPYSAPDDAVARGRRRSGARCRRLAWFRAFPFRHGSCNPQLQAGVAREGQRVQPSVCHAEDLMHSARTFTVTLLAAAALTATVTAVPAAAEAQRNRAVQRSARAVPRPAARPPTRGGSVPRRAASGPAGASTGRTATATTIRSGVRSTGRTAMAPGATGTTAATAATTERARFGCR